MNKNDFYCNVSLLIRVISKPWTERMSRFVWLFCVYSVLSNKIFREDKNLVVAIWRIGTIHILHFNPFAKSEIKWSATVSYPQRVLRSLFGPPQLGSSSEINFGLQLVNNALWNMLVSLERLQSSRNNLSFSTNLPFIEQNSIYISSRDIFYNFNSIICLTA